MSWYGSGSNLRGSQFGINSNFRHVVRVGPQFRVDYILEAILTLSSFHTLEVGSSKFGDSLKFGGASILGLIKGYGFQVGVGPNIKAVS